MTIKNIVLLSISFFVFSSTAFAQEPATETGATEPSVETDAAEASALSAEMKAELDALKKEMAELRHEMEEKEGEHDGEHEEDEEDHDDHEGEDEHADEEKKTYWQPEFTLMGDFYAQYAYHDDEVYSGDKRTGFFFRNLEIELGSELADEVYALIALHMTDEELHLEAGYVYWSHAASWLGITFGVFRQKFGRNNEIHSPEMNQFDRPIVVQEYLGDHGMVSTGLGLTFRTPKYNSYSAVIDVQLANGTSSNLFSGEYFNPAPTGVIHWTNQWEKEKSEVRFGLSGMFGANNEWGVPDEEEGSYVIVDQNPVDDNGDPVVDEDGNPVWYVSEAEVEEEEHDPVNDDDWRLTAMGAMDLTAGWRYGKDLKSSVMWQSEFMYIYKQAYDPEHEEKGTIHAMGAYSFVQWRFLENLAVGFRGDVAQPLDFDNEGTVTWGVTPYITWYQNDHLRIRAQYSYTDWAEGPESHADHEHGHSGERAVGPEHVALLQITFAIGEGNLAGQTPQRIRGARAHGH